MKTKRKITLETISLAIHTMQESIGNLARMTKNGFDDLEERLTKKIDAVDEKLSERIDAVYTKLDETKEELSNRSERIERRIDNTLVSQVQLGKLESRVEILEKKTGVR
jgi:regulator of sigma D